MRELNSAELLGREVKCWNRGSGCGAVLPASKIAQHFQTECVKSLREEALRKGFTVYQGDKIYLLGYYLSPGVYLQKQSETVTLHARIRLNMGDMDDVVHWPFTKTVKLRVLHPTRWAEREINETLSGRVSGSERPDESSTAAIYTTSSLNLDDLINDGYVERDELRVEFELLP
ncbi:hypothetical protein V5799_027781 [Amblyomma americanum]|uniref:TRAF1-6 MATH domain-containing protein n=1 Tax=Amblyomma americanum TaxID=6943 RepID=A0AAQ4DER1_AMBAM